jgi:CDP-diacylglycerol--glycerol-3-phosphate 3-phosphatidyltransferase
MAATYAAVTGSLMVSYARARAEAMGISCKEGVLSRAERYAIIVLTLAFRLPQVAVIVLAVGTYITLLQRVLLVLRETRSRR